MFHCYVIFALSLSDEFPVASLKCRMPTGHPVVSTNLASVDLIGFFFFFFAVHADSKVNTYDRNYDEHVQPRQSWSSAV